MNGIEMNKHDDQAKSAVLTENKGRRRFVRAVSVAVPVALTVSSRSAMATTCNVVSAHASIKLANSHNSTTDQNLLSNAKTPQFLLQQDATYFTDVGANGLFSKVFGSGPVKRMRPLLIQEVPQASFASFIAAAYVNLKKNPSGVGRCYTFQNLKDMWTYGPTGDYQPLASNPMVKWGQQQVIDYLTDTWT